MGFISGRSVVRPIDGNPDAPILIIGDCPDKWAFDQGKPFAHASETILISALHHAGLMRYECRFTNLIYDRIVASNYWREKGHKGSSQLLKPIKEYQEDLATYLAFNRPKVIVALGELTMFALLGRSKLGMLRGYPFSTKHMGLTIIPSYHPRDMIYKNYEWRYYLGHDLSKAKAISEKPELLTQERHIYIPRTFIECQDMMVDVMRYTRVSFDIEVSNYEVSCIGYSGEPTVGYSIPMDDRWTEEEEIEIWKMHAGILENPSIEKVCQNGIFDCQFLASKNGVFVEPIVGDKFHDTMVKHHIMYPDFLKGLNFLGSIHSYQPFWKDELEKESIKKES